jgi:WD40 repeat protein/3',5'-cyclic AMP phosphodiesterase CpdA
VTDHEPVTILHLSDTQLGSRHRFGAGGLTTGDRTHDTLAARLLEDLRGLAERDRIRPDLLVLSGDLAEQARPSEFRQFRDLLTGLAGGLGLPPGRVAMVPGNHDVSWGMCRAYFAECEAEERDPAPPYWPKWKPYLDLVNDFYGVEAQAFPVDRPWTLFPMPELKLVVAGLNSTIAETHQVHHGYLGEEQLRWFARQLRDYQAQGWLRVGVLHHNPVRGPADDAHLHDADQFARVLVPSLNLVLHGHTHRAELFRLGPDGVPVLCAGSSGVVAGQRPEEVPNQYQLIEIWRDGLRVTARCYDPADRRWIGDTRISEHGDRPYRQLAVAHRAVDAALPAPGGPAPGTARGLADLGPEHPARATMLPGDRPDDLLTRVEEICRLRIGRTGIITREQTGEPPLRYLRVTERVDGQVTRTWPLGVCHGAVGGADLDAFADRVERPYRAADQGLVSTLVYQGDPAPETLRRAALARGIRLESFVEYQGVYDLGGYAAQQTARLAADSTYPEALYVPQRYRLLGEPDTAPRQDLLGQVVRWLTEPDRRFVLVLGEFGRGKSFLLRQLARRMCTALPHVVPLLIDLRTMERVHGLDELTAYHLAAAGEERIDLAKLRYLRRHGRVALLFDGFDELEQRVTYDRAAAHLDTMLSAVEGEAKVVLTCRTQHFARDDQLTGPVARRLGPLAGRRIVELASFDQQQIEQFLTRVMGGDRARGTARWELVRRIGLAELAHNPRVLGFLARLEESRLGSVRSAATLYQQLVKQWLEHEYERAHPPGSAPSLTVPQRWDAVTRLAIRLYRSMRRTLGLDDLSDVAAALDDLALVQLDTAAATHAIGSGTLLSRTGDGEFSFVHHSLVEWLVARHAAGFLLNRTSDAHDLLSAREMSDLAVDFLCGLAGEPAARSWAVATAGDPAAGPAAKANALAILKLVGTPEPPPLRLAGGSLRGSRHGGEDLRGADLTGADLTEADLSGARLDGARLRNADLTGARLDRAALRGADLTGADLTRARLLGADLAGARLEAVRWRRTTLVGAQLDGPAARLDPTGSARPDAAGLAVQFGVPRSAAANAVAVDPAGDVIYTGGTDGQVRVWEAESGMPLRSWPTRTGSIHTVAVGPGGGWLATASSQDGVRTWDAATGQSRQILAGPPQPARALAIAPDGSWLATVGIDGQVQLWDTATGRPGEAPTGHAGPIWAVAIAPDGGWFATGSVAGIIQIWNHPSRPRRAFMSHTHPVRALAIAPDGSWLATVSVDGMVQIRDSTSGQPRHVLPAGPHPVRALAIAPDGSWLATGDVGGQVRLWETSTGQLRQAFTDPAGPAGAVLGLAIAPDGSWLVTAGNDRNVQIWDVPTGQPRDTFTRRTTVRAVAIAPDGGWLATGSFDGTVQVWNRATGRPRGTVTGSAGPVLAVAVAPDGGWLATGSFDGTVQVWDATSGRCRHTLTGHRDSVLAVAVAPDGSWLATGSVDGTVRVWDAESGRCRHTLAGHTGAVWAVAVGPDGGWLATGSDDHTVQIWSVATGQPRHVLTGHTDSVLAVAIAPAGGWLVSAGSDHTLQIWDTTTRQPRHTLTQPARGVLAVAIAPDGSWLATASSDGAVRIIDVATGAPRGVFAGHTGPVLAVAVAPDGRWLATAGADGTVRIWDPVRGERAALLGLADGGWAALLPDLKYKLHGTPAGEFWYAAGLCRFEPGELDRYVPGLQRLPEDAPLRIG